MISIVLLLIVLAYCHAQMEIQIEGQDGWASKLPTWRRNKLWKTILGGKPLTGYHFWMVSIFVLVFHASFLFENWTLSREWIVLGTSFYYFILEDILWFIINPAYGLKKFLARKAKWHKDWIWFLPACYWFGLTVGGWLLWLGLKV